MAARRSRTIKTKNKTEPETADETFASSVLDAIEKDDEQAMAEEKLASWKTSLEAVYGKQGPPVDDPFNIVATPKSAGFHTPDVSLPKKLASIPEILAARKVKQVEDEVALTPGSRRVTLLQDHIIPYPDLYLDVFVAGPAWEQAAFAEMFARASCSKAESVDKADLVVFVGGNDVDPRLYLGEEARLHPQTDPINETRDTADINLYMKCLNAGIPMFGVCRGMQLGAVLNGAKLFQHVNNHYGDHSIWDVQGTKHIDKVSSVHHQMVQFDPKGGMKLVATASESTERWENDKTCKRGKNCDVEAFFYPDTMFLGVQGHPEYRGYPRFTAWCLEQINEYIICNPDIAVRDGNYRIKPEILETRKGKLIASITPDTCAN